MWDVMLVWMKENIKKNVLHCNTETVFIGWSTVLGFDLAWFSCVFRASLCLWSSWCITHCVPQKKYTPQYLIITSANVDRFWQFFHQLIREKILYAYTQRLPPYLQYVATLPRESRKSKKCYWFWWHPQLTVDMFLRTLWTLDLTFDSS